MAKYDELSEIYSEIDNERIELEKSTKQFISGLVTELIKYLECEPDKLSFFKPDSHCRDDEKVPLWKAIKIQSDNYWHFDMQITVTSKSRMSWLYVCFDFGVKPKGNQFVFEHFSKNGEPVKEFIIDPKKEEDALDFFDYFYNKIEENLNNYRYPI